MAIITDPTMTPSERLDGNSFAVSAGGVSMVTLSSSLAGEAAGAFSVSEVVAIEAFSVVQLQTQTTPAMGLENGCEINRAALQLMEDKLA